jgi:putative DNA primase/helicase
MLRGARLVVATETTEGRRWDETRIKTLTGGDPVSARFMRRDFFTFTPQFKLLISGNHKPGLRSVDEAIRRRLLLVPWSVTIPPSERDPELSEKLRAEASGILAWAIVGCLEWQDIGLKPPARVLEATESYFAEQDSVARWIEDRLVVARNASATLTALYRDWQEWARDAGEYVHSQAAVLERLRERLGDQIDEARIGKRRDRALLGVGLATDAEGEK